MTVPPPALRVRVSSPDLLPERAHPNDAGLDLKASENFTLAPGERAVVPTGVSIALAEGTVGLVCPRSGLAAKRGISVVNAPGIIDAGYRGEIKVVLINTDQENSMSFERGDRIAQLVITSAFTPSLEVVDSLEDTERGEGGFGSSGGFAANERN